MLCFFLLFVCWGSVVRPSKIVKNSIVMKYFILTGQPHVELIADFEMKEPISSFSFFFSNEFSSHLGPFSCIFDNDKEKSIAYVLEQLLEEGNKKEFEVLLHDSDKGKIVCNFDIVGELHGIGVKSSINDPDLMQFRGIIMPQLYNQAKEVNTYIYLLKRDIVDIRCVVSPKIDLTQVHFHLISPSSKTEIPFQIQYFTNTTTIEVEQIIEHDYIKFTSNPHLVSLRKEIDFINISNLGTSLNEFNLNEVQASHNTVYDFFLHLPLSISSFHFYDSSGNISTSSYFCSSYTCTYNLIGRYPLLGNWKESFSISYEQLIPFNSTFIFPISLALESISVRNYEVHIHFPNGMKIKNVKCDVYNLCDHFKFTVPFLKYWTFDNIIFHYKNLDITSFHQMIWFEYALIKESHGYWIVACFFLISIFLLIFFIILIKLLERNEWRDWIYDKLINRKK
ncbi:hypothetical protein CL6EHI_005980 [Entamoeba histolytica]|nr:hypothetical protein CL6EHI_005980 [Entamoeba histolytica]